MTADERAKELTEAMLAVLHQRKGFDWWWEEIGAQNRAAIKRKMRSEAKKTIKGWAASGTPETTR